MAGIVWRSKLRKVRNDYALYDYTHIIHHLETQAQNGQMPEAITAWGNWVCREIEPQTVHFAISYVADKERTASPHYRLAASCQEMGIFYSIKDVPFALDAIQEVRALHKQRLHRFFWDVLLALVTVVNGLSLMRMWAQRYTDNLFGLLGGGSVLLLLVMALGCLALGWGRYFRWYRRAKVSAELGKMLATPDTSHEHKMWRLTMVVLVFVILVAFVGLIV